MHTSQSILLITSNAQDAVKKQFNIDLAHPTIDTVVVIPEPTIGIESIRNLRSFTSRRPLKNPSKQVIICDAHLLTLEAQNALLKLLEEPPDYLTMILIAPFTHTLLETILSRCAIVRPPPTVSREAKAKGDEQKPDTLTQLLVLSPPARLKSIPTNTKVRAEAITYCEQLIHENQALLHAHPSRSLTDNLQILTDCYSQLIANANPTLSLTDAILRLQVETSLATMAQLPEKNQ